MSSDAFVLQDQGFVLLTLYSRRTKSMLFSITPNRQFSEDSEGIKTLAGDTYAARNVLQLVPGSITFWQKPELIDFLSSILGRQFGLVRGTFTSTNIRKRTWSLGWHKDMTIAVAME